MTQTNDLLTLNLQYFSEEPPAEPSEPTTPVEPPTEPEVKTVTMTQEELNALIIKEKGRVKSKYADYDDIKTKASEYETLLEEKRLAELSEKERADELAKKYEADTQSLTAQLEALRKQAQDEKIRNAFITVASSAGIAYIDDAIALADLSAVSIGEDGKVEGVDDVVKALVENKPFLVAKKQTQPIGQATNGGQVTNEKTNDQLLAEAADLVRKTGRQEHRVAYAKLKKQLGL